VEVALDRPVIRLPRRLPAAAALWIGVLFLAGMALLSGAALLLSILL
jgi:hypothetical protein